MPCAECQEEGRCIDGLRVLWTYPGGMAGYPCPCWCHDPAWQDEEDDDDE